jgi:hypothetical protein
MRIVTPILTLLLSLSISSVCGQNNTGLTEIIQRLVMGINRDTTLKAIELDNEYFIMEGKVTDGGISLTGYSKNGNIVKIVSWVGLSIGNEIFEFYYKNGKLIFVYEEFHSFVFDEEKSELRHDTTEITFKDKYYYYQNKLIDYVTTGHNRFEDDTVDPEQTLLKESEANRLLLLRYLLYNRQN